MKQRNRRHRNRNYHFKIIIMTKSQFETVTQWQKQTFPVATSLSKIFHLEIEVQELKEALINNDHNRRLEFADCFLLLFGAAKADGFTYEDIISCIDEKMEVNKKRTWGNPNKNGVVNH